MKNVGVFVDVSDFYYRIQRRFSRAKLDFEKYIVEAQDYGKIFRAFAYGMQRNNEAAGFIKCLQVSGFEAKYKRPKIIKVGDREIKQCNWDCGITIDVVKLIDKLDVIILGVSNPDYIPLIKWVRDQGKEVIIFASCIPKTLRDAANGAIEITAELLQEDE
ncbi:MAG: NYN domain-containing protein [Nitrosomonadaceae bacterium]